MSKNMRITVRTTNSTAWSDADRQAFADRNILKSTKVPNKRRVSNRDACRRGSWKSEI